MKCNKLYCYNKNERGGFKVKPSTGRYGLYWFGLWFLREITPIQIQCDTILDGYFQKDEISLFYQRGKIILTFLHGSEYVKDPDTVTDSGINIDLVAYSNPVLDMRLF